MKFDSDFLKAFGSGADPNDKNCMEGYVYAMNLITSGRCEPKWTPIKEALKYDIDNDILDKVKARDWYLWILDLSKNPNAIEYWGNAIYNDYYLVDNRSLERKYFTDIESAKQYKAEIIQRTLENLFDRINVLKVYKNQQQISTIAVKHVEEITDGFEYKILDEVTGMFVDCDTKEMAVEVFESFKRRLENDLLKEVRIKQKITDPEEGLEGWKELSI